MTDLQKRIVFMPERHAPPIADQPEVTPIEWCIGLTSDGCIVLLMLRGSPAVFRHTTPISIFDYKRRVAITASGRVYRLLNPPTLDASLDTDFGLCIRAFGAQNLGVCDITAQFLGMLEEQATDRFIGC